MISQSNIRQLIICANITSGLYFLYSCEHGCPQYQWWCYVIIHSHGDYRTRFIWIVLFFWANMWFDETHRFWSYNIVAVTTYNNIVSVRTRCVYSNCWFHNAAWRTRIRYSWHVLQTMHSAYTSDDEWFFACGRMHLHRPIKLYGLGRSWIDRQSLQFEYHYMFRRVVIYYVDGRFFGFRLLNTSHSFTRPIMCALYR